MVGWCEGAVYLRSPGRPTDIGLQLGKACYPCGGKGERGNVFISSVSSLSFLFHFLPCPSLSSPLFSLLSLFSLSLGDDTKWPSRVDVSLNPNTINYPTWAVIWDQFCCWQESTDFSTPYAWWVCEKSMRKSQCPSIWRKYSMFDKETYILLNFYTYIHLLIKHKMCSARKESYLTLTFTCIYLYLSIKSKLLPTCIHAIPHTVRQNLAEFWHFWTPFPIRFSNLTEFSYHLISYFLKN